MVKKVKKDDKGPPEDVFEALQVESKQAATVVLMLDSPEEDVLSKACEAIYRFVEKAEENKKTMLDLNAIDPLLKLVQHEDRVVHRNACMALGSMAQQPDVRKALRKREETVPSMISLLSPDEDSVVHEFAALCLSSLAIDYSSKVVINEHDGLEPLIRCLSSSDPDVQKNAIETISLMLQDYQTKTSLRELNGFLPILDMLRSDFPVIQHLALVSLQRATEDCENRSALRELEGINKLIEFIGRPEWSDLHVFAVVVLANCLEDTESMEVIKENGGLAKLVAYITDTQPPEDEEKGKGKGKDKGAASRAGKKGKGGDDDEKKQSKGDAEPIIPTLPEVKEHAARAIARAAKNAENRKILHEQEAEKMLILLLSHDDPNVQVAAAQALGVMAENLISRGAIGEWDGIEPLIKMCKNDNPDVREAASMALANLTTSNMANCNEVVRCHGVDPLVTMLKDPRELAGAYSAMVLTNMAPDETIRFNVQQSGVIQSLIEPLQSCNTTVQSKAALCVSAYCGECESRSLLCESGGIEPLVALLASNCDEVRRSASWAISVCAADEPTAGEISRYGGLTALQQVQLSKTKKNAFTDVALDKLLNSNLSAKYALKGCLGSSNFIPDGFFDVGQLKPDATLLTIEDYCRQDINQKRPVLLVNAQPEAAVTPAPIQSDVEVTEKSSRSSVTGRSSRTGRDGKAPASPVKSRAQREKEDRQREEEAAAAAAVQKEPESVSEQPPFSLPGDTQLLKYIEEVQDRVGPLPTTRDQVVALAQVVADKMGGPIERGQLANFSWELPISQLKFELQSNVIPIGAIKQGIHYHRALLFKVLGDRIAVHSSLVRGEYNRAWNEVMLTDDTDAPGAPRLPPKCYIVDLIHQPGCLMPAQSPTATNYKKL